jgi:cell division protein ZapA (FtsZ GTPase activity inhibitor)
MEKYSIKVNILNRPYPLLVKPEEEEVVRTAAMLINEKVKEYKDRFSVKDEMDLVIMCCLELATDNLNQIAMTKETLQNAEGKMDVINEILNRTILQTEESGNNR